MADAIAGERAKGIDVGWIYREYFERTERKLKAVIQRLVAINEHCMKKYNLKRTKKQEK